MAGLGGQFLFRPLSNPIVTAPSSNTPSIVGFGTVSSNLQYSWRCGSFLMVQGIFSTGTSTATQAQIPTMFNGSTVTVDTSRCNASGLCGTFSVGANSGNVWTILVPSSNQAYVNMGVGSAGTNPMAAANGNSISGSAGQTIGYFFSVPIVGW